MRATSVASKVVRHGAFFSSSADAMAAASVLPIQMGSGEVPPSSPSLRENRRIFGAQQPDADHFERVMR